jgi:putative phosphoribosyl transferase
MPAATFHGPQEVRIDPPGLDAVLTVPLGAAGLVVFAHGSGSSRLSPRNTYVAKELQQAGMATLLLDLLAPAEAEARKNVFDIVLLSRRLIRAAQWASEHPATRNLALGFFGASTGAGAALKAAAEPHLDVAAIVSRGGRPDLAGRALQAVRSPTLLIVGSLDGPVIQTNKDAYLQLNARSELVIVPGASHLFEEPGALDEVVRLAALWFRRWFLTPSPKARDRASPQPDLR